MNPERLSDLHRSLRRRNVSGSTVRNSVQAVIEFSQCVNQSPQTVPVVEVGRYVERLQERRLAAKTIKGKLSAVRQSYDSLQHDPLPGLVNPVRQRDFLREPRLLPRAASEEDLAQLFSQSHSGRERALGLVLLRRGLRVAEAVGVELPDVALSRQTLRVRAAKNRRERLVHLSPDTRRTLAEYLAQRGWPTEGQGFGGEQGQTKGQRLSMRGVQKRLEGYARCAGVPISGHVLRHSVATPLLNQGVRLVVIHEVLGHAHLTSTQRYARLANRRVREEYFQGMEKILGKGV